MSKVNKGHFFNTTVEIEYKGKKVRVAKDVAEILSKKAKKKKPATTKAKPKNNK